MYEVLLGASALAPSLLLVTFFHRRDVFPEPPAVLWRTFGLGILIVLPVLAVALPLDALAEQVENPLLYGLASAFLGAAIPEEFFKFVVLYFYAARHMEFDEPMDGLVYGATASLGFATLENILYVSDGGFGVAALRAVLAVPGHAFLGVIMGWYVSQAKFSPQLRTSLLTKALVIPTLLHGFYDTPLLAVARVEDQLETPMGCFLLFLLPLAPAIVLGEAVWSWRLVQRLRSEQLAMPTRSRSASAPSVPVPAKAPFPAPARSPVPAVPEVGETAPPPFQLGAWVRVLVGGTVASLGSLVVLAVFVELVSGGQSTDDAKDLVLGALILGGLPLLLGGQAFIGGIRRLNVATKHTGEMP